MPHLKTYDLFISHAWSYGDDYHRLVDLLDSAAMFKWRNYSAPKDYPVVDPDTPVGKKVLAAALERKIKPVNCVLIISGMYAARKEWIQKEIELAQKYDKPIVGIWPRGAQVLPRVVADAAHRETGWSTASIVKAIREISL